MPRAKKQCGRYPCRNIVTSGTTYCPEHRSGWSNSPRTASSRRTSTQAWKLQRAKTLQRDGGLCQVRGPNCGVISVAVDHLVSVANGGTDDLSNTVSICKPCHDAKTAREANAARNGWKRSPEPHQGLLPE
jgi:5-methylcytosine-specific restriction protein A